jgi:hypothetical protein
LYGVLAEYFPFVASSQSLAHLTDSGQLESAARAEQIAQLHVLNIGNLFVVRSGFSNCRQHCSTSSDEWDGIRGNVGST